MSPNEQFRTATNTEGIENSSEQVDQPQKDLRADEKMLPKFEDLPFSERVVGTMSPDPVSPDEFGRMVAYLEHHNYSDEAIGGALRRVAKRCTTHQTLEFYAILTKRLSEV